MRRPSPEIVGCPSCGARNFAIDDRCFECGDPLVVVILPRPVVRHVGLGSVMAVIAVVALCLAPVRFAPELSLVLATFFIPAAVRGVVILERRRLDGRPTTGSQALTVFMASFFVTLAIVFPTALAFATTAYFVALVTVAGHSVWGIVAALAAGAVAALYMVHYVGRMLWPEKD